MADSELLPMTNNDAPLAQSFRLAMFPLLLNGIDDSTGVASKIGISSRLNHSAAWSTFGNMTPQSMPSWLTA